MLCIVRSFFTDIQVATKSFVGFNLPCQKKQFKLVVFKGSFLTSLNGSSLVVFQKLFCCRSQRCPKGKNARSAFLRMARAWTPSDIVALYVYIFICRTLVCIILAIPESCILLDKVGNPFQQDHKNWQMLAWSACFLICFIINFIATSPMQNKLRNILPSICRVFWPSNPAKDTTKCAG